MRKIKQIFKKAFKAVAMPVFEENNDILLRKQARLINIASLHQKSFYKFKGCNSGKNVVIVGAGPSVKQFKPIKDCIYIGLNRAFLLDNIKFDYLFTIDKIGIEQYFEGFGKYECLKFVGDQNLGKEWQIPETEISKMKNVLQYKTDSGLYTHSFFTKDIDSEPLGNFNTVSLQAMQFALYTQPNRIYLVGIDCSTAGHFVGNNELTDMKLKDRGSDKKQLADDAIIYWKELKDFADLYYPGIEIISVNPVGLKGLFKDLYQ